MEQGDGREDEGKTATRWPDQMQRMARQLANRHGSMTKIATVFDWSSCLVYGVAQAAIPFELEIRWV